MTAIRPIKLAFLCCALPFLASCWFLAEPKTGRTEKVQAVPVKAKPTAEEVKKIEQLYYQAVDAYTKDDFTGSDAYLKEIFKMDPSYAPAKELKEKLKLAGKKPRPQIPPPASTQPARSQPPH